MTTLRQELVRRFEALGVEERVPADREDGFSGLFYEGKAIGHFHSDNGVDLKLGREIIAREKLLHPSGSTVHPKRSKNSPWIEFRYSKRADLVNIVRLLQLALKDV